MSKTHTKNWSPDSWKNFEAKQQPKYNDEPQLKQVTEKLSNFPALVVPSEIRDLKSQLAKVAEGNAFLLQGGDCAESFAEFNEQNLTEYFKVIMQMTVALIYGAGKPVVKVGRIAGQFAKPRSADFEEKNGEKLPSYRGDIINNIEFSEKARENNPENLVKAYHQSSATLNYLRSLARNASMSHANKWNDEFIQKSDQGKRFTGLVDAINDCQKFMKGCGISVDSLSELHEAKFYISHEGLLLPYEQAFIRQSETDNKHYACSAHLLWIGDRTRGLEDAHIEFFRGIENPIASKVGPTMGEDELIELIETLNPNNEKGKLTLISRMGKDKVNEFLPKLVERVKKEGKNVIWSCDPMHGNTQKSSNGYKTRDFDNILSEIKSFFEIHKAAGTYGGGIHFEMTGQDVTECIGGLQEITDIDLNKRYHTHCDPRLNASQSLELAFLIAEELKRN